MFQLSIPEPNTEEHAAVRATVLSKGFHRFPSFASESTCALLESEIERLITEVIELELYGKDWDKSKGVSFMETIDNRSDLLFDMARESTLMTVAEGVIGKPPIPLQVEYFSKPPEYSEPSPPHQDHVFYNDSFNDETAISLWIALDDVEEQNGALEYATVSPLRLLPHKASKSSGFKYELTDPRGIEFISVPVCRGGCIVHHSYAVHRAPRNRSDRKRRAVVFNYRGSSFRASLRERGKW